MLLSIVKIIFTHGVNVWNYLNVFEATSLDSRVREAWEVPVVSSKKPFLMKLS